MKNKQDEIARETCSGYKLSEKIYLLAESSVLVVSYLTSYAATDYLSYILYKVMLAAYEWAILRVLLLFRLSSNLSTSSPWISESGLRKISSTAKRSLKITLIKSNSENSLAMDTRIWT